MFTEELEKSLSIDIKRYLFTLLNDPVTLGNWELYYPIPMDRGGYDTFEILREELDLKLKHLLEVIGNTERWVA